MNDDEKIRDDVLSELEFLPQVDATAIGATVHRGVVTLSGHVGSYAEKVAAEAAALRVKGVRGVAQEIDVRLPKGARCDDAEIVRRATEVLRWTVMAPKTGVKVRCEGGWVILTGQASWAYQRYEAERTVRGLAGVVGVTNQIDLVDGLATGDIKHRIESALGRNAEIDASAVRVAVHGSKVTLEGKVSAWRDRNICEQAAWAVPGVYQVIDHLSVS
jgi:osmotically-inducible protein OsmY